MSAFGPTATQPLLKISLHGDTASVWRFVERVLQEHECALADRVGGLRMQTYLHDQATVIDPDTVLILTSALDEAWQSLQAGGVDFSSRAQADAARESLALRIIEMAKLGERDQRRLSKDALVHLARSGLRASGP
jgi:hypothetical protein